MQDKDSLHDCIRQLEEVAKTIESLAGVNMERSANVDKLLADAKKMQQDIQTLYDTMGKVTEMSGTLHILAINTAIEAARQGMPTVRVVADEMDKVSKQSLAFRDNVIALGKDIENKVNNVVMALDASASGVAETSAALEQLTASTEQLVATLESLE